MNVQRSGNGQLPQETCDTGDVRIGHSGPVIALRMDRVIAQHRQRFCPIPKAHQGNLRVDGSLRFRSQRGIRTGGVADRADLAVRSENAAVGGDLRHESRAKAEMSHRAGGLQRFVDGTLQPLQRRARKGTLVTQGIHTGAFQDFFRTEIAVRRIVLVQRVDRDPGSRGARRRRQSLLKSVMSFVADSDPVHGA